jgi:hypothetical protein
VRARGSAFSTFKALPLAAVWLMRLMRSPPLREERVLLAYERRGDLLA